MSSLVSRSEGGARGERPRALSERDVATGPWPVSVEPRPRRGLLRFLGSWRPQLDGWGLYLVVAVCFAPVLVPPGPGRTALEDPVNAVALAVFGVSVLAKGKPISVPFLVPALVITLFSTLATFGAANPGAAIFTIIQDAYLYFFFVMLVNMMANRGEFRGLRVAWVITGVLVALIGLAQVLTHGSGSLLDIIRPKGYRAVGSFDQPDELADFLVMSVFMTLSLSEDGGRLFRWGSAAIMCLGIAATKANGGIISLGAGLIAWTIVRTWTKRAPLTGLAAGGLLAACGGLLVIWLIVGMGVGSGEIKELEQHSFLGRMGHSTEGRAHIWDALWARYLKSPIGLGPGNCRWQRLRVDERERPTVGPTQTFDTEADPFMSKEAHNDYFAYMVERGPISLLFMLIFKTQVFIIIVRWWKQRARDGATPPGGALAAALFGAWVASWINSNTIETLHFRHVWVFMAMVCALGVGAERELRAESVERLRELPVPHGMRASVAT